MYNLQSRQVELNQIGAIYRIHGDDRRKMLTLSSPAERNFDLAIVPLGVLDPAPYWMDAVDLRDFALSSMRHFGEVYLRDNDVTDDETLNIISDSPIVFSLHQAAP